MEMGHLPWMLEPADDQRCAASYNVAAAHVWPPRHLPPNRSTPKRPAGPPNDKPERQDNARLTPTARCSGHHSTLQPSSPRKLWPKHSQGLLCSPASTAPPTSATDHKFESFCGEALPDEGRRVGDFLTTANAPMGTLDLNVFAVADEACAKTTLAKSGSELDSLTLSFDFLMRRAFVCDSSEYSWSIFCAARPVALRDAERRRHSWFLRSSSNSSSVRKSREGLR